MGLFNKKKREPRVHPAVARRVHVAAPIDAVVAQLDQYSQLHSPKHAAELTLQVGQTSDGATVVRLPGAIHPWLFHNVAIWLLDTPDQQLVTAVSAAGAAHPGYWLVRDPEMMDCLCGLDDEGRGWTVNVPMNEIARPDGVPVPAMSIPTDDAAEMRSVVMLGEDPGHDMNPDNEATEATRKKLEQRHHHSAYSL